jgi:NAD(P)-dependent dehydrogenase (short-subunit alcohol dehydrogenase family)
VSGALSPSMEHASGIGLKSVPRPSVAVVFGAGGGIGSALVEALHSADRFGQVIGFSRGSSPSINLLDEASLERAASFVSTKYEVRLVIDATGSFMMSSKGRRKAGAISMRPRSRAPSR